jgi:PAS domain S-box-containing protein
VARLEADNARLRDTEQRTHQVAESLLVARLALTRTLDLDTILETLLDHLGELVPYDSATIFLLEGSTHLVARAARGYDRWLDREAAQVVGAVDFDIGHSPRHRALVTTQKSLVIEDTRRYPSWQHIASSVHVRSWMGVPLVAGGETIGLYSLDKTEPGFFTQEHLRWAEGLAAQAAIAVQNALLYNQAQRELDERQQAQRAEHEQRVLAEALRDIAALLNSSLDLDEVFEGILTHVARVVPSQVGSILLVKGDVAEVIRVRGYGPAVVGIQIPLVSSILSGARETGRPVVVDDTRTYPGWITEPETDWIRSSITAAIRTDEEVIGFLCLDSQVPSAFSPEHVRRLETFANQAGTAVRNARLFAEIERQKQYSESLVQNSPVAIVTTDRRGCIASWNPAAEKLFGYQLAEAIGQDLDSLEADARMPALRDAQQTRAGSRLHTITERRRKDGSLVDVEIFALSLGAGQEQRYLFIYHDLTELKHAERELEQAKEAAEAANRAKSAFLANMSHELRTPLNAILGFARLMARDPELTSEQQAHLEVIDRSGEHLLGLINDVLELSKIEAGHAELYEESFDLYRLLVGLEEMFRLRAADEGLYLVLEQAEDVPQYVHLDQGKLRQVLINLLGNAVKFTHQGGITLRVGVADGGGALHFEVEDTGVGIADDELEAVFDAFVQTASGQQVQEGTGLGLSISRQFARMMGGDILVSSELGKGSLFRVDVRYRLAEVGEVPTAQPARRVVGLEPGQTAFRLLVAEDHEASRDLLVRLLESVGFEVHAARNGREAIEMWERWQPHLIWMDFRMPEVDGYQATRRIKATPRGQNTVVIALTASAFEHDQGAALAAGCSGFVRKPFLEAEIFDTLAEYLGVRYVYAKEAAEDQAHPSESRQDTPAADRLGALPPALVMALQQATVQGRFAEMLDITERIREHDEFLADELAGLVDGFCYDEIQALIERAGEST